MQLFDYGRILRLMDAGGIDAILATGKSNVRYLSGYTHPLWDDDYLMWDPSVSHKNVVGIPKDASKSAFLVASAAEINLVENSRLWIQDRRYWGPGFYIQSWKEPGPDPGNAMVVAAEALAERGLADGCIAIEMRYLGVSYFERLKFSLPCARFVDAEPILWAMRMVKSAEEIRLTREACTRTAKAWQSVMQKLSSGMTEVELQKFFKAGMESEGVQFEGAYCVFGPAGVVLRGGPNTASANRLVEGYFVRTDIQATFEGYYCDMSRIVGFGRVTPEMVKVHTLVKEILNRLVQSLRPGMSVGHVRELELELYKGTGYGAVVPYTGHSTGLMVHEPPYLFHRDQTVLAPGMVLTLEPTVCYSHGGDIFICLEDQVLITEEGCENLTAEASLELHI